MATTLPVTVGLPRVADGVLRPGRGTAGKVGILDEVPLALRALDDAEAPRVLRHASHDARLPAREWREHEGRLYASLLPEPEGRMARNRRAALPLGPESLPAIVEADVTYAFANRWTRRVADGVQPLADWNAALRALPGRLDPLHDAGQVRVLGDDGLAAQAAFRERIEGNLIVVDGVLHHRSPLPCISVHLSGRDAHAIQSVQWFWPPSGEEPGLPWDGFPPHRAEAAMAYARLLAGEAGGTPRRAGLWDLEILDAEALARAYEDGPEATLRRCVDAFVRVAMVHVGHLGDEGVLAWLRLRQGPSDARSACADLALACEACEARATAGGPLLLSRVAAEGRQMLARIVVERGVGVTLDAADEEALLGLAP